MKYREAMVINQRIQDHLSVAANLNNIANIYYCQNKYEEAQKLYLQVLAIKQSHLGAPHEKISLTFYNLAVCCISMRDVKKVKEALDYYVKSFTIMKQLKLWNHPHNQERIGHLKNYLQYLVTSGKLKNQAIKTVLKKLSSVFKG